MKQGIRSLTLIPSTGGCFEVTAGKQLIYSKLKTGQFPDPDAIVATLRAKLG